ncbi:MAG: methyltransferase domain-containing protein [Deinococcus sp.]|nr:methyltransferase domain-containing protein [Deinococcus sp.]
MTMLQKHHAGLSRDEVRLYYNHRCQVSWLDDWYSSRAKALALKLFDPRPGQRLLEVGVGTGQCFVEILKRLQGQGELYGVDLSPEMVRLTNQRAAASGYSGYRVIEGAADKLPFVDQSFDGVFCTYVLDLLPQQEIVQALGEFQRILRPGGRVVLAGLTPGQCPFTRLTAWLWTFIYCRVPLAVGGCRPLSLAPYLRRRQFAHLQRHYLVQRGVPSEIMVASRL